MGQSCWKVVGQSCCSGAAAEDALIVLNVSGRKFTVRRATFRRAPEDSALRKLVNGRPDKDGTYFLDRDDRHFPYVLNFLRDGPDNFVAPIEESVRRELRGEADWLGLPELVTCLESPAPYPGAPIPSNEALRLRRLDDLDIMHTKEEERYDSITRIVAALMNVPIALISLVHEDHQWFKSRCGLQATQTPRNTSFCAFTFTPKMHSMFVIEDARIDPRVRNNPLVLGEPFIVFYAGSPLTTSDGVRLGALCAIDRVPKKLSTVQAQTLVNFCQIASQEIERTQLGETMDSQDDVVDDEEEVNFGAGKHRIERMRDALKEIVLLLKVNRATGECLILYANHVWTKVTKTSIEPPTSFPGCATVAKQPGRIPSFWEWFELQGISPVRLARMVYESSSSVDPCSIPADGRLLLAAGVMKPTSVRISVSGRVQPLQLPLDVNASAIQPVPARSNFTPPRTDWSEFGCSSDECLCYFLMHSAEFNTVMDSDQKRTPTSETSTPSVRRQGTGLEAVDALKPPPPPFRDVKLIKQVGEGSFGKVFYGVWLGSPVAVKVIESAQSVKKKMEPIFEAALAQSISHPNLVQTYKHSTREKVDSNVACDTVIETWIVQEWCDRGNLNQLCTKARNDIHSIPEVLDICADIAGGGAYLHSRGIIHGDLTANNVLIKTDVSKKGYRAKICDFGLARVLEGERQEIITTQLGTVTHMPPELFQLDSAELKLTTKTDIYAVGILLWQALSGRSPFDGLTPPQVVMQVASGKRPVLPPTTPQPIRDIFDQCTSASPQDRPDFDDLIAMFTTALAQITNATES